MNTFLRREIRHQGELRAGPSEAVPEGFVVEGSQFQVCHCPGSPPVGLAVRVEDGGIDGPDPLQIIPLFALIGM